jgi:Transposase and inactivated derivatives, IS1 family
MILGRCCPKCESINLKRNGHIHNGKQNYQCKECGRQFVLAPKNKFISEEIKEYIKKLLLERISLRGICRVMNVSLIWLLGFIAELYEELPDDLNLRTVEYINSLIIQHLEAEVDEMWSFVTKKDNKQWIGIALDVNTRQVVAFHVGDRSRESAKALWEKIPESYRKQATFYTDLYDGYSSVIPEEQYRSVSKDSGKTCHIERFNCTVRQRISRLVRKALSFSKKLENHIGAIKYFFCYYNLSRAAALPV